MKKLVKTIILATPLNAALAPFLCSVRHQSHHAGSEIVTREECSGMDRICVRDLVYARMR